MFGKRLDLQRSPLENFLLNWSGHHMRAVLSFSPSVFAFPLCIVACSTHDLTSGWPFNLSRTLCAAGLVQSCRSILFLLPLCSVNFQACEDERQNNEMASHLKIYRRSLSYKVCLSLESFTPFPLCTLHTLMVRIPLMISLHSALECLWISIFSAPTLECYLRGKVQITLIIEMEFSVTFYVTSL